MEQTDDAQSGTAALGVVIVIILIAAGAFAGGMWYTRTTMQVPAPVLPSRISSDSAMPQMNASSSGQPAVQVSEAVATIEKGAKITFFTIDLGQISKLSSARVPLLPHSGEVVTRMNNAGDIFTSDGSKVYRINALTGKTTVAYESATNSGLIETLVLSNNGELGISYGPDRSKEDVTGTPITLRTINAESDTGSEPFGSFTPDFYSRIRYLDRLSEGHLVYQIGGDGCGGFGKIFAVRTSTEQLIETGAGCSNSPRFIGYDAGNERVIIANVQEGSWPDTVLTTIEAVPVSGGSRTQLHNFTMEPKPVKQVVVDLEVSRLAGLTDDGFVIVYLKDGAVKRVPFKSDGEAHQIFFLGEVIYVADYNKKTFTKLDLLTQNTSTASYEGIFDPASNSPAFAGLDPSGRPIFYALEFDGPLY